MRKKCHGFLSDSSKKYAHSMRTLTENLESHEISCRLRDEKRLWFYLLVGLVWATIFTEIPWGSIRQQPFADLDQYKLNFLVSETVFTDPSSFPSISSYVASFVLNEGFWDISVRAIGDILGSTDGALWAVSFCIFFTCAWYVSRSTGSILAPLLLMNPVFIDMAVSQLRSGLALSFFILGIVARRRIIFAVPLFLVSISIHSAFSIVVMMFIGLSFLKLKVVSTVNFRIYALVLAVCISILLSFGKDALLQWLGDRRVGTDPDPNTFLYSSFWIAVFLFILMDGRRFTSLNNSIAASFLFIFIFVTLSGFYGSRFLAFSFPFMIPAVLFLPNQGRLLLLLLYAPFCTEQFYLWMKY